MSTASKTTCAGQVTNGGEIASGISTPFNITAAVPSSQLWVVGSSCEILQFPLAATGNVAPTLNIQGNLTLLTTTDVGGDNESFSYAVDFDSAGNQYVFEYWFLPLNLSRYSIVVFAPSVTGNIAPIRNIVGSNTGFGPGVTGFEALNAGLCLDGSGNIYAGLADTIYKFPAGSNGNATSTIFVQDSATFGPLRRDGITSLRFDVARQWIWVTFNGPSQLLPGVRAYDLSGVLQRSIINATTFQLPCQVTISSNGSLVISDISGSGVFPPIVNIFDPSANGNSAVPIRTIQLTADSFATGLGVAITSADIIYASAIDGAGSSFVSSYPFTASGLATPLTTIQGNLTGLDTMLPTSNPPNAPTFPQQLNIR